MKNEIHKDEGYKLMGAASEVYDEQGFGMAEEIYQMNFGHSGTLEWKRFILSEFIGSEKSAKISAD